MVKNLCVREAYKGKDGTDKIAWNRIGVLFTSGDREYVKLYHLPGVLVSVFEPKPKNTQPEEVFDEENF